MRTITLLASAIAAGAILLVSTTSSERHFDTRPTRQIDIARRRLDGIVVIPRPKSMTVESYSMPVTSSTVLDMGDDSVEAANVFEREIGRYASYRLPIGDARRHAGFILIGTAGRSATVGRLLRRDHISPPMHEEGYVIDVEPRCAVVAGHDAAGTFYGTQTLCQLLRKEGGSLEVPGVRIVDYPTLRFRGAHLFCGVDALPFHERLIANIFARFKLNNLVLQCEQARWKALGDAAPKWAMPKSELRVDIDYAERNHMTVTPLVELVGHMGWLLGTPGNADLAEDPKTPYAAAVDNPRTDRTLFRLYDEVLDTFHSPVLHIGGDEVAMRGRYPCASRRRYPTAAGAFVAQVDKLHDYLARKHVRTMLWADMLLARDSDPETLNSLPAADAQRIREALPKDIDLVDWHYADEPSYPSVNCLRESGYKNVIASTWNDPKNIQSFAYAIASGGNVGLLQTTWAGYDSSADNLKQERAQFVDFVIAAEEAWNGGRVSVDDLGYDPAAVFDQVYRLKPYR